MLLLILSQRQHGKTYDTGNQEKHGNCRQAPEPRIAVPGGKKLGRLTWKQESLQSLAQGRFHVLQMGDCGTPQWKRIGMSSIKPLPGPAYKPGLNTLTEDPMHESSFQALRSLACRHAALRPHRLVAQQAIVIKFSHVVAKDTPKGKAADYFAKIVAEKTAN